MAQIFVSYARADRTLVAPLVAALEAQGWSLWWDFAITSGQEFDRLIASELDAAQAVIVVWTPNSVESRWVRGEAREGASRGVLVPVRFGNARLPLDVRSLHTTDLDNWRGASDSAPFQELVRALRRLLAEPGDPPPTLPATTANGNPQPRRKMMIAAGIGALVLVGIVGLLALKPQGLHRWTSNPSSLSTPSGEELSASAPNQADLRVAVLPFDVLSDAPATHHFAEGLTDEIVSTLNTNQMQTVSAEDSAALRGANRDETLARLNANLLFDGTVEDRGDDIHVRVHLDSATDHAVLWSGDFAHAAKDAQTLQTEVAARAGGMIQLALFAKSPGLASIDSQTLALTLKVVDVLRFNQTVLDPQVLIQLTPTAEQVVTRAPDFAWGHSILATALAAGSTVVPPTAAERQNLRDRILGEAQRALALDPKDAMAYFTLAGFARSPRD